MVKYTDGLDAIASALANPGRRQVVSTLSAGPATSSQLATALGIGLPGMQKQLAALTAAGLISSVKEGRVVTHRLRVEPLRRFDAWLTSRAAFWEHQLDALAGSFGPIQQTERKDDR